MISENHLHKRDFDIYKLGDKVDGGIYINLLNSKKSKFNF